MHIQKICLMFIYDILFMFKKGPKIQPPMIPEVSCNPPPKYNTPRVFYLGARNDPPRGVLYLGVIFRGLYLGRFQDFVEILQRILRRKIRKKNIWRILRFFLRFWRSQRGKDVPPQKKN
jgi:hypothetical protein